MKKNTFIENLKEGDRIVDVFQVKTSRLAETRAGKPYIILTLMDKSGDISSPVWDDAERLHPICQAGAFVQVSAAVQSYRDKPQLKIDSITPVPKEDVEIADFIITGAHDIGEMAEQLQLIVNSVKNPFVRKLLGKFFTKGQPWERFKEAPAAKGIHHAYVGGLLEHVLSIARVADFTASHYPGVDRSILLAGAMLHDIGKLKELTAEVGMIDYTAQGRLKGHLVIGSEMVAEAAKSIKDFPENLLVQIQHLILSHHGRLEFGSPTVPMTVEAFLLCQIDDMDAKMNLIEQLRTKQKTEGLQWSEYQRTLERFLYLSPYEEEVAKEEIPVESLQSKQQSLF
jgi:3'-5' exoribonuclease